MINTLLIGCGYHARRIYVPHLREQKIARLSAILDLSSQKQIIEAYLRERSIEDVDCYFTDNTEISDELTQVEKDRLEAIVAEKNISAVIISTEPLAHLKYARWALERRLHILMDKPITTECDVSTNPDKAKKIFSDYLLLKDMYLGSLRDTNLSFILQAQRRHHLGFLKVRELIIEMARKTNCPVTSIQAFHSDGQWRFPKEILEQSYHPYNQGYGKMSHSGYHSLDASVWFAQASVIDGNKKYDNFELYSQVVRPLDFFSQLTPDDYTRLFPQIDKSALFSSSDLSGMLASKAVSSVTGELDAHTQIALRHADVTITNIGLHAVHNGFSQRNWISAVGRDLYKGNGRVRHESYVIEQGPFQCIIVNSFQSHEIFKSDREPGSVGGEYHYDIHIFRNSSLFPEYKAYDLVTINELSEIVDRQYSRGHQEEARRNCVEEFFAAIERGVPPSGQVSNFLDHELSTMLLSAIYQSVAGRERVVNGHIANADHE